MYKQINEMNIFHIYIIYLCSHLYSIVYNSHGSVVSFQKTAAAFLASVVAFLKTAVAVLMRLF